MTEAPRPRDLALMLLAAGVEPPRQRARDQQADRAGLELRRELLQKIVLLDPEPDDFERSLGVLVVELGGPTGPSQSTAQGIFQDWNDAIQNPRFWSWLVGEALSAESKDRSPRKNRRQLDVE